MRLQYYIIKLMTDYTMLRQYTSLLQTISTETAVKSFWCGPLIWTWVYVHILVELELNLLLMKSLTWTCISKCEMRTLSLPKRKLHSHLLQRHLYILAYIQNFTVYGIDSTRQNIKKGLRKFWFLDFLSRGRILGRSPDKRLQGFPPWCCHLYSFAWDLYYFKLTQNFTVFTVQLLYTKVERRKTW